jgi:tetratricopeptide (TPR) repeat protein
MYFINAEEIWNNRSFEVTKQFSWVLRLPLFSFAVVGPLAILGLVLTARDWRRLTPFYALIAVYLATGLIFFVLSRYRIPAVPILIIFAASACVWLYDAIHTRRKEIGVAVVALLLFVGVSNAPLNNRDLSVAYYNLGNKYRLANQHGKAIVQYRKSLAINGGYISARNNFAISLERSGTRRDEAIKAWGVLAEMGRRRGLARYIERAERHLLDLGEP